MNRDAFELLAERNFETLMTYDSPAMNNSHKFNLMQLEIIQEEKKEAREQDEATERVVILKGTEKLRKPFKGKVNFTVNTGMCRSELELIQHVIDINGFGESQTNALGNLVWYGLALHQKDIELLLKRKTMPHFNRYPGLELLARKKTFCAVVNRQRKTFPKKIKFCPRSF
jgi:hypothetical protein